MDESPDVIRRKAELRQRAYAARRGQLEPKVASQQAIERLLGLPQYHEAETVLWYVDCRTELQTQWCLPAELDSPRTICVPYCTTHEGQPHLGLWQLERLSELVVGKWKILEPPRDRWHDSDRAIEPAKLDVVIAPGVGFSPDGRRLGNGQGYYDRLLKSVQSTCSLIGLCYECQVFSELPVEDHDIRMDFVVTEQQVYRA